MAISLSKTIPKTSTIGGYPDLEGGGSGFTTNPVTIVLNGANNFTSNTKKALIKIKIPKSESSWSGSSASDVGDNTVKDLKRVEDTFKIRGWLEDEIDYGTATSSTSTTLTDTSKSWTTNIYNGATITITGGTGAGQTRTISSNTSTQVTVTSAWTTNPDSTSAYEISFTAWQKAFMLRAMCAAGGPLNNLIIDNLTFDSGTVQVYLEEVTFIVHPGVSRANNKLLNQASGDGNARVEVDMSFYMGDPR